jgi:hypothetical protein
MEFLYRPSDRVDTLLGNAGILLFLCVQGLDGALTYLGMSFWGHSIEGNPLISSAVAYAGLGTGLVGVKLLAIAFGIMLHRRRFHYLVALLTAFYVAVAIVPWMLLFGSVVRPHATAPPIESLQIVILESRVASSFFISIPGVN